MGKFQSYLEWQPEKFKEERAKGALDIKPFEKQKIPEWLDELDKSVLNKRISRTIIKKNASINIFDRVIVTPDAYYVADDLTIHWMLIGKLMFENIIIPNEKILNDWERMSPLSVNFLCMQVDFHNEIKLSESYRKNALSLIIKNKTKINKLFKPAFEDIRAKGFDIVFLAID